MKDWTNKVAGITGAACGIGKAFAQYAAQQGMRLALIDIDDRVEDVKKECEELGSPKVVSIKVEIVPIMKEQGTEAHFLITGSIGSLQPGMRIQSAYTASKHAALSLAESISDYAKNWAPNIGVTCFCPEYINTEIYDSERCRPERFKKPYDPFYATADYNDYKANFEKRIKTTGFNPRFVGPRLFRAMEDNQLYVHPHMHTHQIIRDRFARIEADLRKDEELDAEFKALEGYDD